MNTSGPKIDGSPQREHGAASQFVIEALPVGALKALLKRQGGLVLVLHQEDALSALMETPSSSANDENPDDDSLSPRESEVLALVANGVSNRELSETLFISRNTVKTHLKNIMRKLRTKDRNQTALMGRIICGDNLPDGSGVQ